MFKDSKVGLICWLHFSRESITGSCGQMTAFLSHYYLRKLIRKKMQLSSLSELARKSCVLRLKGQAEYIIWQEAWVPDLRLHMSNAKYAGNGLLGHASQLITSLVEKLSIPFLIFCWKCLWVSLDDSLKFLGCFLAEPDRKLTFLPFIHDHLIQT